VPEYVQWFGNFLDPYHITSGIDSAGQLLRSSSLLFWGLVFTLVRYTVPDLALWIVYIVRRSAFDPPPLKLYARAEPLVSVVIAGRNPGQSIVTCIRSVLDCDYKNLEVIFADDKSTDDSVALARTFERTGRVRVFANDNWSGKAVNLNVALNFARGEFVYILDSDTMMYSDTIRNSLPYFENPRVGAVAQSIFVRNKTASLITRFQRIEYMMTYTLTQLWRGYFGIIAIVCGMGGMYRMSAVRGLGGFDTGLGDDTDLTIRLRKARWKIVMSLRAEISTDVPETLRALVKQRVRWTRNMVKVRLRKHRDMATLRYGWVNCFVFWENVLNRTVRPYVIVAIALYAHLWLGRAAPVLIGGLYIYTVLALFMKVTVARDMTGEPPLRQYWLVPFYVFYRIPLLLVQITQIARELLRIKLWHPYVPRRIWDQIPHH
jgi:cellulose synthase/poly-beta-1,6-N-acetylglucosamine synthase-like glycosyltransferase